MFRDLVRRATAAFAVTLLFLSALLPARAEEGAVGAPAVEVLASYTPTPTALPELIGPDDESPAGYDFALANAAQSVCFRDRFSIEDGLFVFDRQRLRSDGFYWETRDTFSSDGVFLETTYRMREDNGSITMQRVTLRDEGVVIEQSFRPEQPDRSGRRAIPDYAPKPGAVPGVWQQLVIAYHIRTGNDRFFFRSTGDATRTGSVTVCLIDDLGVETIEVMGQTVEAHVLMIATYRERAGEPADEPDPLDRRPLWYVLADGTIVRMISPNDEGEDRVTEAIAVEDARALFLGIEDDEGGDTRPPGPEGGAGE